MKRYYILLLTYLCNFGVIYGQWTMGFANVPTDDSFRLVEFASENVGYITTAEKQIYKTTDGGTTFQKVYSINQLTGTDDLVFSDIEFTSEETGCLVGISIEKNELAILNTTNGGISWTATYLPFAGTLLEVIFPSVTHGYVVGENGVFLKTTNAGVTWEKLNVTGSTFYEKFQNVSFVDNNIGFVNSDQGKLYKTIDGGISWETITLENTFGQIQFFTSTHGIAKDAFSIYKTDDGGNTWIKTIQFKSLSYKFLFTDQNTGYVGANYSIKKTIDGGKTWFSQGYLPSSMYFNILSLRGFFKINGDKVGIFASYISVGSFVYEPMIGKTLNGGGFGADFSLNTEVFDCYSDSLVITPSIIMGNPDSISWTVRGQMSNTLDPIIEHNNN
jgi:photosystem II stability/assembly factor-like uncharacterized protein